MKIVLRCTTALAAVMWTTTALAAASDEQAAPATSEQTPPEASEQSSETVLQVEDIMVTAQRRSERLQNVPIAVVALSAERLAAAGALQTTDLAAATPGLVMQTGVGFLKPTIRGVGSTATGAGNESPVAIYVDGVYIANGPGAIFSFNNIDRIEVLKGPQGTLFGRNATGGLVHVLTRDPTQKTEVEMSMGLGNYEYIEGNAYVAGGLTSNISAALAVQGRHQGKGYGENTVTGEDVYKTKHDISARAKTVIDLGRTTIKLGGDYINRDTSMFALGVAVGTRPVFASERTVKKSYNITTDFVPPNRFTGGGGSAKIEHDLGWAQISSLTAYRNTLYVYGGDLDASARELATITMSRQRDKQFSQEVQLQSTSSGPVKWVVGAFYFDATAHLLQRLELNAPLSAVRGFRSALIDGDSTTRSIAGYGQATYEILPDTNLTGGFRYTWEKRGLDGTRTSVLLDGSSGTLPFQDGERLNYQKPTWRLSLDHKIVPNIMVYASYNRGFKSGGFNISAPGDAPYLPEKIDAYEVGAKTTLANGRIRLDLSAYRYDYSNMQVFRLVNGSASIYNGAEARLKGIDLDSEFVLGPNFNLRVGASYLDGKFTSFKNAIVNNILPSGLPQSLSNQDVSGNRTPNSPKFTASIAGDLHFPVSFGELGGNISYYYNDGYYTEADNVLRQDAYHMINIALRWKSVDERYTVQLYGRNLLSEYVANQTLGSNLGFSAMYQPPMTYGVTVGTKF